VSTNPAAAARSSLRPLLSTEARALKAHTSHPAVAQLAHRTFRTLSDVARSPVAQGLTARGRNW
jgi:hypothetical protein